MIDSQTGLNYTTKDGWEEMRKEHMRLIHAVRVSVESLEWGAGSLEFFHE